VESQKKVCQKLENIWENNRKTKKIKLESGLNSIYIKDADSVNDGREFFNKSLAEGNSAAQILCDYHVLTKSSLQILWSLLEDINLETKCNNEGNLEPSSCCSDFLLISPVGKGITRGDLSV
jgi:hypothetical protein